MSDTLKESVHVGEASACCDKSPCCGGAHQIESIPLRDASVDVIISNCVIDLSGDKDRVLAEAIRVFKPGGRFAVVVVRGEVPRQLKPSTRNAIRVTLSPTKEKPPSRNSEGTGERLAKGAQSASTQSG